MDYRHDGRRYASRQSSYERTIPGGSSKVTIICALYANLAIK